MDANDSSNSSRTTLRQPFIDTANALASLYKQAVSAEREALDRGSRTTYMRIMEWAARKSRAADRVTPGEIINFCASELAKIPSQVPSAAAHSVAADKPMPTLPSSEAGTASQQGHPQAELTVSVRDSDAQLNSAGTLPYGPPQPQPMPHIPRDDGLVSDIKKLHVNPRKRQRVDISDAFIRACRNASNENGILSPDYGYSLRAAEASPTAQRTAIDPAASPGLSVPPRRDSRDSRDAPFIPANFTEYTSRKGRSAKAQIYDKMRKK